MSQELQAELQQINNSILVVEAGDKPPLEFLQFLFTQNTEGTLTMPRKTTVAGVKVKRGERMKTGKGWKLVSQGNKGFPATLLKRLDIGDESIAIFRVLPNPDGKK